MNAFVILWLNLAVCFATSVEISTIINLIGILYGVARLDETKKQRQQINGEDVQFIKLFMNMLNRTNIETNIIFLGMYQERHFVEYIVATNKNNIFFILPSLLYDIISWFQLENITFKLVEITI